MCNNEIINRQLTQKEILENQQNGYMTMYIAIPFSNVVKWNTNELNTYVSELLFGNFLFSDIYYDPIEIVDDNIILSVTGDVSNIIHDFYAKVS